MVIWWNGILGNMSRVGHVRRLLCRDDDHDHDDDDDSGFTVARFPEMMPPWSQKHERGGVCTGMSSCLVGVTAFG